MHIELEILAFMASLLGVGGSLPQIIKMIKTRSTQALSYCKYVMVLVSSILWITYGIITPIYSIIFWSTISGIMSIVIIALKYQTEQVKNRKEKPSSS